MKKLIKNLSKKHASKSSLSELLQKSDKKLILPFYHCVADAIPNHIKHLYKVRSIEAFEKDLKFLKSNFKSVSLDDVILFSNGNLTFDEPIFHLTFDDGLKEVYENVFPILKKEDVHCTVFLNADFVDNKEMFYRFKASLLAHKIGDLDALKISFSEKELLDRMADEVGLNFKEYLAGNLPYLTSEQIIEMKKAGISFGSHSLNHPLFKELRTNDQIKQVRDSISSLESRNLLSHKAFSFPFTDDGVTKTLFEGIRADVDVTFGTAGIKDDEVKNNLQRIPIEKEVDVERQVKEELAYYILRKKIGKHLIKR